MQQTENLNLPLYELDDMANLSDGYNSAMNKIDAAYAATEARFPIKSEDIEDGGINTVDIANGAITTNKIATAAITSEKLADGTVETEDIAEGAITISKISSDSIDSSPSDESNNLVTSNGVYEFIKSEIENIPTPTIQTENIANGAITRPKISNASFDAIPTANSDNLISSGSLYTALQNYTPSEDVKNVLYVGNSYVEGYGNNNQGIYHYSKDNFTQSKAITGGGLGFMPYSDYFTTSFQNLLTTEFQESGDVYTDIVFFSAMGDSRAITSMVASNTFTNFITSLTDTINYVKSNFTKAKIHVCMLECCNFTGINSSISQYGADYPAAQTYAHALMKKYAPVLGYNYLGWLGWNYNMLDGYSQADGYHPNDTGYRLLAREFISAMSGSFNYIPKKVLRQRAAGTNQQYPEVIQTAISPEESTVKCTGMRGITLAANTAVALLSYTDSNYFPVSFIPYAQYGNGIISWTASEVLKWCPLVASSSGLAMQPIDAITPNGYINIFSQPTTPFFFSLD